MDINSLTCDSKVKIDNSEVTIAPSILKMLLAALILFIGLVFLFVGGLLSLVGFTAIVAALLNAQTMFFARVSAENVLIEPRFAKLPLKFEAINISKIELAKVAVSKRDVNGRFTMSPAKGLTLWPLNSQEVILTVSGQREISLGLYSEKSASELVEKLESIYLQNNS